MRADVQYWMGVDLGARSIGWQLVATRDGEPTGIAAAGVHTFDAGVDGDLEGGRDESRGVARRQARQLRRQLWRRQRRRLKVLRLLREAGLLPPGDGSSPAAIHRYFLDLDARLQASIITEAPDPDGIMLPYRLRAAALDRELSSEELGRAIYHLAQRRGFKSIRKSQPKKDEEPGEIKKNIGELYAEIERAGARTLGEYFSRLNPREQRVRRRHTHRDMFIDEFQQIWAAQARYNGRLTEALRRKLFDALFFQRPLKNQSHLIGECDLLPGRKRAPLGLRVAQRFRLLQTVNNLLIEESGLPVRRPTPEERQKLISRLETVGDIKFKELKNKIWKLKDARLNLERGDEDRLVGDRTSAKLRKIFGDR